MVRSGAHDRQPATSSWHAPLSFGQERLWFLAQLQPSGLAYNRPWALRLRGELDVDALQAALGRIVKRHAALRTTVEVADGAPRQRIHPFSGVNLPIQELAAGERAEGWRSLALEQAGRPFDLERDPPFRPGLLRLDERDHILLLTTHHIAFDAWSEGVLLTELAACYRAAAAGGQAELPELAQTYAEYAGEQRAQAEFGSLAADLDYWQGELGPNPGAGRLSVDSLALERQTSGAGEVIRPLSTSLSAAVRRLGREHGATPFMVFSAALAALLSRLEAASSITIGYPTAGRTELAHESIVGLFVNTLPLGLEVDGDVDFLQLLGRARRALLAAAGHQRAPFERIVDRVQPPRQLDESPLFNVLLNFRNLPARHPEWGELVVTEVELPDLVARYDLSLHVSEADGAFRLRALYPRERQSDERIEGVLAQLVHVLEQVAAEPGQRINELSLIPAEHQQQLPDPSAPLPKPGFPSALDMFLERAAEGPDRPAVVDGDGVISYRELQAMAHDEAARFQGAGLRPGDVVALAGPPCVGRVAGMLAAFLCGAIAQPLDARQSAAAQRADLARSGARLLVRYGEMSGDADGPWPADLLVRSRPARPNLSAAGDRPLTYQPPESRPDPAYLFTTSGSTGDPKAVLGSHQGLAQLLSWQRETFSVGPGDRSALINNLAFDISLRDMLTALVSGAAVCIPDLRLDLDSGRVIAWMKRTGVTFVHLVPSIARYWLNVDDGGGGLSALRLCTFAGEPLTADLVDDWRRRIGSRAVIVDLYGPTETTLVKTWYRVPERPVAGVQPLGHPLPSAQVLVQADDGQQCGFYEPGELIIRTPFRSHGYLDGQAQTAFVKNPHTDDPTDLLFKTGDLGRRRADGCLEYLGRLDRQVKIHGVRVDTAQVEAVLAADPAVAECAVAWRSTDPAGPLLSAYVVPALADFDLEELQTRMRTRLAGAALPRQWMVLDRMPLTANGKLDWDALPAAPGTQPAQHRRVPPANDIERKLLRIWQRALNVGEIGVTDNYFDLGGHSLLALRIFSMIDREIGVELPVSALFEAPTIRQLAARIESGGDLFPRSVMVPVQTGGSRPPIFWVHAAGGHVLSYQRLANFLGGEQPFYAIQGEAPADRAGFRTVEELAGAYVDAIRREQPSGPYFLGGLSFGGLIAWEMAQRLRTAGEQVAFLGLLDTRNPELDSGGRPLDPLYALRERFQFHRGQLSLRPFSAWPRYVRDRAALLFGRVAAALVGGWAPRLARRLSPTGWHVQQSLREADWARRRYRVQPYRGRLTVFRAQTQPRWSRSPSLGWQGYAEEGVDVVGVPGTHVSIISGPNLTVLAEELKERLRRAQGEGR